MIPIIKFINVNKTYNGKNESLKNINLSIKQGEFVFIKGRSGAGKSTLIKLLTKEEEVSSGEIIVLDEDITKVNYKDVYKYRRNLGIVFQDFKLISTKTVFENIELAMKVIGATDNEVVYRIMEVLSKVGLAEKYKKYPNELSTGERQRVCIARAIVNNPKIILADECTANLDLENSIKITRLLKMINEEYGITVLMATHDTEILKIFKEREILMSNGELISDIYKFF